MMEAWRLCCGSWQNSRYGVSSPSWCLFQQIPASKSLLFLFSLTEGANSGQIWRSSKNSVLVTEWAWLLVFFVLSGEATLLHSSASDTLCMFQVMVELSGLNMKKSRPILK